MKYLYTIVSAIIFCIIYIIFDIALQKKLTKELNNFDTSKYFVVASHHGIGNQMFQYAASLSYAKKHNKVKSFHVVLRDKTLDKNS